MTPVDAPDARPLANAKVTPRARRWLRRLLFAFVVVVVADKAIWWTFMRPKNPMTVEQVERLVSSAVQPGDSPAKVQAFLAAKRLPHSYYDGEKVDLSLDSEIERTGVPVSKISGAVRALIPDTGRSFLATEDIGLTFVFDRKGRLIRHQVRAIYTGM
jgi:hypothetical protein